MANLEDYLKWRGDLPFEAYPLNPLDNLFFAMTAYVCLHGIATASADEEISLAEASKKYSDANNCNCNSGLFIPNETLKSFYYAAELERFKNVKIVMYRDNTDTKDEIQFAAMTYVLPGDAGVVVSFRGTDDSLIGWKEDLNMSFMNSIPSQREAVNYLNEVVKLLKPQKVYVTGHSKGANLAMYSAAFCDDDVFDKISRVSSFDGPGFPKEIADSENIKRIQPLLDRYVPQTSVVGFLLENSAPYKVVKSTAQGGINQHNGFTWQLMKDDFEYLPDVTAECRVMEDTIKSWLSELSPEKLSKMTDSVYSFLSASHATTLTELNENRSKLMGSLKLIDNETRKSFLGIIRCLIGAERKRVKNELET